MGNSYLVIARNTGEVDYYWIVNQEEDLDNNIDDMMEFDTEAEAMNWIKQHKTAYPDIYAYDIYERIVHEA